MKLLKDLYKNSIISLVLFIPLTPLLYIFNCEFISRELKPVEYMKFYYSYCWILLNIYLMSYTITLIYKKKIKFSTFIKRK